MIAGYSVGGNFVVGLAHALKERGAAWRRVWPTLPGVQAAVTEIAACVARVVP